MLVVGINTVSATSNQQTMTAYWDHFVTGTFNEYGLHGTFSINVKTENISSFQNSPLLAQIYYPNGTLYEEHSYSPSSSDPYTITFSICPHDKTIYGDYKVILSSDGNKAETNIIFPPPTFPHYTSPSLPPTPPAWGTPVLAPFYGMVDLSKLPSETGKRIVERPTVVPLNYNFTIENINENSQNPEAYAKIKGYPDWECYGLLPKVVAVWTDSKGEQIVTASHQVYSYKTLYNETSLVMHVNNNPSSSITLEISDSLSVKKQSLVNPLKQIASGTPLEDVKCNDGYVLIKSHSGNPACVKPQTAQKLVERGWGSILRINQ